MNDRFVSPGLLPDGDRIASLVADAFTVARAADGGHPSDVYPALARVDAERFGVNVVAIDGRTSEAGDADAPFAIMSVAKPFVFALVCTAIGIVEVRRLVGLNATGLAFNALEAVTRAADGRTNPMVNPGAVILTSEAWTRLGILSRTA